MFIIITVIIIIIISIPASVIIRSQAQKTAEYQNSTWRQVEFTRWLQYIHSNVRQPVVDLFSAAMTVLILIKQNKHAHRYTRLPRSCSLFIQQTTEGLSESEHSQNTTTFHRPPLSPVLADWDYSPAPQCLNNWLWPKLTVLHVTNQTTTHNASRSTR